MSARDPLSPAIAAIVQDVVRPLIEENNDALIARIESLIRRQAIADVLSEREAAKYLRIHPGTLQRYRASGKVTSVKIGGSVRYRRTDLDALLEPHNKTC